MTIREQMTRLKFLLFRKPHSELDEELQFHLDHATQAKLAAGFSPREARRRARIDFGSFEHTREETYRQRPGWLLETLLQDARYALRGFRRNPAFALTAIATLALGIGASTAVFSVVDRILFRSLPYAQDGRLVSVGLVQPLEKQEFMLGGFFYEWQQNQKPFASLTFEHGTHGCNLTDANPVHLQCADIAQNFLSTLGVSPVVGRKFLPEEDLPNGPKVAILSDSLWLRRFNRDPAILSKAVFLDEYSVRIVGILPKGVEMPRLRPVDILVPAAMDVTAQHTVNGSSASRSGPSRGSSRGLVLSREIWRCSLCFCIPSNGFLPKFAKISVFRFAPSATARCRRPTKRRGFCSVPSSPSC